MKRLGRIVLMVATGVSLVLCVSVIKLWVRSYRAPGLVGGVGVLGAWYNVHAERGRVVVSGPPAAAVGGREAGWERVRGLTNDDVRWQVFVQYRADGGRERGLTPYVMGYPDKVGTWNWIIESGRSAATRAALLRLLGEPDGFVAGHVALTLVAGPVGGPLEAGRWENPADGVPVWDDGEIRLRAAGTADQIRAWGAAFEGERRDEPMLWWADPGQRGAMRARWGERLNQPIGSLPVWPGAVGFAVGPVMWGVARGRRVVRRRRGWCVACGYDLRATPGRCPECGRVV